MKIRTTYALTESLSSNNKWIESLKDKLGSADWVEFNTLFGYHNLRAELEELKPDLVKEGRRKDKIYPSGIFRRYTLSPRIKRFILSKSYDSWRNYQFEDLSLLKGEVEILATITHENYLYVLMNEEERNYYNENGYRFGELFEINKNHA